MGIVTVAQCIDACLSGNVTLIALQENKLILHQQFFYWKNMQSLSDSIKMINLKMVSFVDAGRGHRIALFAVWLLAILSAIKG